MDGDVASTRRESVFGPFRLDSAKRLLAKEGAPVAIGGRALDVLIALVERAGDVVTKQELITRICPNITVDEGTLRVHVAALRKALGDGRGGARYVTNVSGRGYCFVAPVAPVAAVPPEPAAPSAAPLSPLPPGLPRPLARMVGREAAVSDISARLAELRFVTLHGPGGIGKTTVAVAVTHAALAGFANAVAFVDLGATGDPSLVPSAVAASLGVAVPSGDPVPSLLNFLRRRRVLLVLDNCEHVIDAAARLAEVVFREAPGVSLLTTSREALRVEGEHVYPLPALETPPQRDTLAASEVLTFPATNLFVERAAASGHRIDLNDADAAIVAEICRKLDGNALAIELAAGRVGVHGLPALADLLDSRLRLLWHGRRTAAPRHQTLNATLDWSYNLVAEAERTVLCRLSILVGSFTLQAAEAIATDGGKEGARAAAVVAALEELVAKSLVQADTAELPPRYRLLETTRAYARTKLADSGEEPATVRRHAAFFRTFLEQTRAERTQGAGAAQRIDRASLLGNVRAALDRCFAEGGDRVLGIELAAAAAPLFIETSLLGECRLWTERALAQLDAAERGTRIEMELQAGLGHSLMLTNRNSDEAYTALGRSLELARALGDRFNQFRVLNRLHLYHRRTGEIARTLDIARQMEGLAEEIGDPVGRASAHVQLAVSYHLYGDQARARSHIEAANSGAWQRPMDPDHFGFHRSPRIVLCRVAWLQGFPDQALEAAGLLAKAPLADDDPVTSIIALIWCAMVFGWSSDWDMVEKQAERLIAHATAHFLVPYRNVGLGLRAEVQIRRGAVEEGVDLLRRAIASLEADRYHLYVPNFGATLIAALISTGHAAEAIGTLDAIIAGVEEGGGLYVLPELLRLKGMARAADGDKRQAQLFFEQAQALAEKQSALSWQLRIATSQLQLAQGTGRAESDRKRLADLHGRFTEGFATADLLAARALLNDRSRKRR